MYGAAVKPSLDKKLRKLIKKNRKQYDLILKKVEEIVQNPLRYKNLRKPLQHLKQVHIDAHFVLTFSVDEITNTAILDDFNHHDDIYS